MGKGRKAAPRVSLNLYLPAIIPTGTGQGWEKDVENGHQGVT